MPLHSLFHSKDVSESVSVAFGTAGVPLNVWQKRYFFLVANLVTTSKALVTRSDALVSNSFLLLLVRHLLLLAWHLFLVA